jgi:hypothetical protein
MSAGNYGTIVRVSPSRPRLKVYRGYDPNEPTTLTQTAPVASNVTVYSGQLICLQKSGTTTNQEWVLCTQSKLAAGAVPYLALQDGADFDVRCTGLTGLSCAGDFEVGTGFYDTGETYDVDTALTASATGGNIAPAGSGEIPIGYVTRGYDLGTNLGNRDLTNKDSTAANLNIVVFTTNFGYPTASA